MTFYLFVSEDEQYIRTEVHPDEFKAASKGELKIFEIGPGPTVNVYCSTGDAFDKEVERRHS